MDTFLSYLSKVFLCCLFLLTIGIDANIFAANSPAFETNNPGEKSKINNSSNDSGSFFPEFTSNAEGLSLSTVSCDTRKTCKNGKLYTEKKVGYDCITVIILPSCSSGKKYDPSTCSCKSSSTNSSGSDGSSSESHGGSYSSCHKVCDKVWCESDGTKYKQVLDRNSCSCYTVRVAKAHCNYGQVYDKHSCKCVDKHTTVTPCYIRCDSKVYCDGKGNLTKSVLNDKTCKCETKYVNKPNCPSGKVYDKTTCGCVAKPSANCDNVKVSTSHGTIHVSGLVAPHKTVEIYDRNMRMVYNCRGNCKEVEEIKNMKGEYHVYTKFYNSSWHYICGSNVSVSVSGHTQDICSEYSAKEVNGQIVITGPAGKNYTYTITVKDEYGHAVCKDITLGGSAGYGSSSSRCPNGDYKQQPGTPCNDHNPYTSHDKIQHDGCTCKGKKHIKEDSTNGITTGRSGVIVSGDRVEKERSLSLYPNPAKNNLLINLRDYEGQQATIRLVDHVGQVVHQMNIAQLPNEDINLNLQGIAGGLHYLNVTVDHKETITEKVMINKF